MGLLFRQVRLRKTLVAKRSAPRPNNWEWETLNWSKLLGLVGSLWTIRSLNWFICPGTFARVWLSRLAGSPKEGQKVFALKILRKVDSKYTIPSISEPDLLSTVIRLKQVEHIKNERNTLSAVAGHPFITTMITSFSDRDCLYMLVRNPCPEIIQSRWPFKARLLPWGRGLHVLAKSTSLWRRHFTFLRCRDCTNTGVPTWYEGHCVSRFETRKHPSWLRGSPQARRFRVCKGDLESYADHGTFGLRTELTHLQERLTLFVEHQSTSLQRSFGIQVKPRSTNPSFQVSSMRPLYFRPSLVWLSLGHGTAVDWWAFGILIYEFLVGQPPFWNQNPMKIYELWARFRLCTPVPY